MVCTVPITILAIPQHHHIPSSEQWHHTCYDEWGEVSGAYNEYHDAWDEHFGVIVAGGTFAKSPSALEKE